MTSSLKGWDNALSQPFRLHPIPDCYPGALPRAMVSQPFGLKTGSGFDEDSAVTGDHDALLRAVCEHPREDTPRLVFADFLEENGTPRAAGRTGSTGVAWGGEQAQFIRSDIAMSLRDEWDADRLRWEWVEKPATRAEPWFRAMFPPLPRGLSWPPDFATARGFPAGVRGGAERLRRTAAEVFRLVPANAVELDTSLGNRFADPTRAPWFGRVRRLRLPPQFPPRDVVALAQSQFTLGIEEVDGVAGAAAVELIRSPLFPRLSRVLLGSPGPGGVARAFEGVSGPVRLRALEFGPEAHAEPDLFRVPAVLGVEHLELGNCLSGATAFQHLVAAPFPHLRSLGLTGTFPGAAWVRAFCGSRLLAGLRRLRWGHGGLNSALAREFARHSEVGNLRVLDLSSNAIGNDGGAALFTSPHLAGLKVLDLTHCMIGDDALRALLDDSPLADGLVFLNLTGSPASAEMKQAVKDRMGDRVRV